MPASAGTAVLDVIPGLDGFARRLQAGVDPVLRRASGNVKVDADTSLFRRNLDRDVDRSSRNVEHRLGGAFRSVFALVGGLGAGLATISFFKGAFDEAEEARKTLAQTEAVLKSTGGAAKVSASDIDTLATRLSNLTGIDDEAIAANENLLLTFTGIRNEAGKGNDIFNQATKTVLDMSVALGQDGKSSAIQLGKALNDPIKGITALQRVGVSFTEQQKSQIRTLVESGNTLEAQKIILAELNKEFGGSAAAAASPLQRLGVAFNNIKEQVGTAFLPVMQRVATFLADRLPGAIARVGGDLGKVKDAIVGVFDLFVRRDFSAAFARAFNVEEDAPIVGTLFKIRDVLASIINFIRSNWQAAVAAVVAAFGAWAVSAAAAAVATIAAAAPAYAAAAAIAALAAGLIYAYQHWEGFRNVVDTTVRFLTGTVVPAVRTLVAGIAEQFANLVTWVRTHWDQISEAISHVVNFVRGVIEVWVAWITFLWRNFGDELMAVARVVWDQIRNIVETVVNVVRGIIQTVLALINGDWGLAWDGIKGILAAAWEFIRETVVNALRIVGQVVEAGLSAVRAIFDAVWNAIKDVVIGAVQAIGDTFLRGIEAMLSAAGKLPIIGGKFKGLADDVQAMRERFNSNMDALRGKSVTVSVDIVNAAVSGAAIGAGAAVRRHFGGPILGAGNSDTVPAMLTPGEFVLRKSAVQAIGLRNLEALNAMQGFATGGYVGLTTRLPDTGAAFASIADTLDKKSLQWAKEWAAAHKELWPQPEGPGGGGGAKGPGAGRGGLTAAATALLDAVLARFPGQRFTSGYRSPAQNAAVGGAPNSDHMYGRAIDIAPGSDAVAAFGRAWPGIKQVIWQAPGHYDHTHLATQMHQGGIVPGTRGEEVLALLEAGETVRPLDDVDRPTRLHPDDIRALAQALRDAPPIVHVDAINKGQHNARMALK